MKHFDIKLLRCIVNHRKLRIDRETGGDALNLADFLA
jgi:hypothetical protein